MKVGFAIGDNEGMESKIFDHFGSSPAFVIVDTVAGDSLVVKNRDLQHVHGACNPLKALEGKDVDFIVVGGIGAGALTKLNASGVKVFGASAPTVKENLALLAANKLRELSREDSCHAHRGGCSH